MLDGRWRANVERGLEPIGKSLNRAGINPDVLTVLGLVFAVATALLIASGHFVWAVVGVIATGVPDILDGTVARHSGRAGPRGAFLDSVSDRVSDAVMFGGVAWYLTGEGEFLPVLAFAAVALSMLISYERAKAESLGFSAKGGIMERAERMVLLSIGLAFNILVPVLWLMVVLMAITAIHRFVKVWQQASGRQEHPTAPMRLRLRRHTRSTNGAPAGEEVGVGAPAPTRRFAEWWAARGSRTGDARRRSAPRASRRRTRP
jgi:CDP-diacylglycerol--glycerol-3-phosphate 3-phosphatidyltransferase